MRITDPNIIYECWKVAIDQEDFKPLSAAATGKNL